MATNYAHASYTEVIDLQTTNGQTSIIGIHTPVGRNPYNRLRGFFTQFRKYRYKGISSLTMVPAANLPVDPLGLTGIQGTTDLMDPRDALNPILFHGAHGTSLNKILNTIYSAQEFVGDDGNNRAYSASTMNVSESASEHLVPNELTSNLIQDYYRCLTDTTWKKFGIQNGVRLKHLHPLVHKLARNMALLPAGQWDSDATTTNTRALNAGEYVPIANNATSGPETVAQATTLQDYNAYIPGTTVPMVDNWKGVLNPSSSPAYVQEFTNGMTSLGWLPTATMNTTGAGSAIKPAGLPKLFMGVLVLPPSYNVEQYFRLVLRHEFEFRDFTTSLSLMGWGAADTNVDNVQSDYYNWIDYSDAESKQKYADLEGVDDIGSTLDMIGGSSDVVSDGVS